MGLADAQDPRVRPVSALVAVGIDYYAYPKAFLALGRKTSFRSAGLLLGGI